MDGISTLRLAMIEGQKRRVFADRAKMVRWSRFCAEQPQKDIESRFLKQRWQDFNFDLATDR